MNAQFHDLKNQMKVMQDIMRKKLTVLTIDSDKTISVLKEKEEKAKQIVRFAEMSRKLETEEEKILPFYASSLTEKEEEDIMKAVLENPGQELAEVSIIKCSSWDLFNIHFLLLKKIGNERLFKLGELLETL
jgi:dynein regulatory complex subunit 2